MLDREDAALRVDDEEHRIGLSDRGLGLAPDRGLHLPRFPVVEPAGVDERELATAPLRRRVDAVARRPGDVLDDRDALTDEAVEEGGFPDVRAPDDRRGRLRHGRRQAGTGSVDPSASIRSFTSMSVSMGVEHPPINPTRS